MGSISKELKELETRSKDSYPVTNKDYYIKKYMYGEMAPPGWLRRSSRRGFFSKDRVTIFLANKEPEMEMTKVATSWEYYLYPGPRPLSKWGPVCP